MKVMMNPSRIRMYDYLGQPIRLKTGVKYKLSIKNGYILALTDDQIPLRVPNLLEQYRFTA